MVVTIGLVFVAFHALLEAVNSIVLDIALWLLTHRPLRLPYFSTRAFQRFALSPLAAPMRLTCRPDIGRSSSLTISGTDFPAFQSSMIVLFGFQQL
jgi:hypothetical protein